MRSMDIKNSRILMGDDEFMVADILQDMAFNFTDESELAFFALAMAMYLDQPLVFVDKFGIVNHLTVWPDSFSAKILKIQVVSARTCILRSQHWLGGMR